MLNILKPAVFSLVFLLVSPAHAQLKCPVGQMVAYNDGGVPEFKASWNEGSGNCIITNPEILRGQNLKVMGCPQNNYSQFTVMMPKGLKHNCPQYSKPVITLASNNFVVQSPPKNEGLPALISSKSRKITEAGTEADPEYVASNGNPNFGPQVVENEGNALDSVFENLKYDGKGIKKFEKVDTYNRCLLNTVHDGNSFDEYSTRYASDINLAASTFDIPSFVLKCTCGKETRFVQTAAERRRRFGTEGAAGICQGTGVFIKELNDALNGCYFNAKNTKVCKVTDDVKAMRADWDNYVKATTNPKSRFSTSDKGCRKTLAASKKYHITRELLEACPSIGLGAASLGMSQIIKRLKNSESDPAKKAAIDEKLKAYPLDAFAAIAGAYNVGHMPGLLDKVGEGSSWTRTVVAKACGKDYGKGADRKLDEVRGHILKIRNCMQEDVYLDHKDNPLDDNCLGKTVDVGKRRNAEADAHNFAAKFSSQCGGLPASTERADAAGGLDNGG